MNNRSPSLLGEGMGSEGGHFHGGERKGKNTHVRNLRMGIFQVETGEGKGLHLILKKRKGITYKLLKSEKTKGKRQSLN